MRRLGNGIVIVVRRYTPVVLCIVLMAECSGSRASEPEMVLGLYAARATVERLPIPLAEAKFHRTEVDGRDIAAIYLPGGVAESIAIHKRFISHNEVRVNDDEQTGWYVIVRYPKDWSCRKVGKDTLCSHPLIFLCQPHAGDPDPQSAYRPEVHILLGFERNAVNVTTGHDEQLPEPYGISGCGVWRVADWSKHGLETVSKRNVSLVAVQNRWHRGLNYIMATRISWVLRRILVDYPELERPMQLAYPKSVNRSRIIVPSGIYK